MKKLLELIEKDRATTREIEDKFIKEIIPLLFTDGGALRKDNEVYRATINNNYYKVITYKHSNGREVPRRLDRGLDELTLTDFIKELYREEERLENKIEANEDALYHVKKLTGEQK